MGRSSNTSQDDVLRALLDDAIPATTKRLYIAFSGGIDSCVLLDLLCSTPRGYPIFLWHINHGLQENADEMQVFCQQVAADNGVECRVDRIDLNPDGGNIEARARQQRYAIFSDSLAADEVLVTAHHLNDQAETLLLNLLRGSGTAGLRAIAPRRVLGQGLLLRPLLSVSRADILAYATAHRLKWIDDPSNKDLHFDRNFLRQRIIPILESRWPSLLTRFERVSRWQREQHELVHDLAQIDYASCRVESPFSPRDCLNIVELMLLSRARKKNLIRYWIEKYAYPQLGFRKLQQLLRQLQARIDAQPVIDGEGYQVRRYAGQLYLVDAPVAEGQTALVTVPQTGSLTVKSGLIRGEVSRVKILARLDLKDTGQKLELRYRNLAAAQSGNTQQHRSKRLYHRYRVPPWLRDEIPQIHVDGELRDLLLF